MGMNNTEVWISVKTAAKMLGKSVRTVRHYIASGKLDAIRDFRGDKRKWMLFFDDVQKMMEGKDHAD